MTTAPPTTVVPTTVTPTTATPDTDIYCDPIEMEVYLKHLLHVYPAWGRDPSRDNSISFRDNPIEIEVSLLGDLLNKSIDAGPIPITVSLISSEVAGETIDADPIEIEVSLHSHGVYATYGYCNFVIWSKIGRVDFTHDLSNEAGGRYMDWSGCVEEIFKLGTSVVVLGTNGVSLMTANGVHWGLNTVSKLGISNKGAAVSNSPVCNVVYFIDNTMRLCKLSSEGLEILDYSEFLEVMTDPILTWDLDTGNIHICDGTYGYVYNTKVKSFGEGPVNVTGIGNSSGSLYVVAPSTIAVPKFHVATDIYDFGNRRNKTIQWIEVGANVTDKLYSKIETRLDGRRVFSSTPWKVVNPSGICNIPCFGTEFKIHIKSNYYEAIKIDYLRIIGILHGFTYMDTLDWRVK